MKKIISISIIAFSVFLGMIIIGRFSDSEVVLNTEALGYKIIDHKENTTNKEGKFIESLEDIKVIEQEQKIETNDLDITSSDNITNQIANKIAQGIIGGAKDSNALVDMLKSGDPKKIEDAYTLTEELIAQKSKEIGPDSLKILLEPKQLNLMTDNSKTAKQKYFSDINYILNSKIKNNITTLDSKALNDAYLQFDSAVNDLKKLRTPSDLYQFHSQTISILIGIKNGLSQIISINSDPAKLLIVLESLEALNKEFEDLFKGAGKLI